jgi:hypothetical protein
LNSTLFLSSMESDDFGKTVPVYTDYEAAVALCLLMADYKRYTLWQKLQPVKSLLGRLFRLSGLSRKSKRLTREQKVLKEKETLDRKLSKPKYDQQVLDCYEAVPQTYQTQNWRDYTNIPCYIPKLGARDGVFPKRDKNNCDIVPSLGHLTKPVFSDPVDLKNIPDDYVVGRYLIPNEDRLAMGRKIPLSSTVFYSTGHSYPNDVYIANSGFDYDILFDLADSVSVEPEARESFYEITPFKLPDDIGVKDVVCKRRVPGAPRLRPRIRYRRRHLKLRKLFAKDGELLGDEDLDLISL